MQRRSSLREQICFFFGGGLWLRVHPCALELQASRFHALFPSLYLCRAARGSADIPILPHAHTILLKHAVNLKRKRTLFTSKPLFHHPIVLPTSRCRANTGDSPPKNSGAWKTLCPSAGCRSPGADFVNWASSSTLGARAALCCWKNEHLNGDSPLIFLFSLFKKLAPTSII